MSKVRSFRTGSRIRTLTAGLAALLVLATAVAAAVPARSTAQSNTSSDAQRLRQTELTRMQALVDADMAVAAPIHADDFQLIPPPGFPLSRDEYLAAVAAGDLDYLEFEPISEIEVRMYGRAAVLTYQSRIDIVAAGLGHFAHDAWHTYLYEKRAGRWQVVWEQATAVGGFPPPTG